MKWNCNIVKEMYDRVNRRRFGLLCLDDTDNENFIKSYLNRLDCTPILLNCLKGADQPCNDNVIVTSCNIQADITYTIDVVNGQVQYTFVTNPNNGTSPYTYYWDYSSLHHWDYVSGATLLTFDTENQVVLTPKQLNTLINTNILVLITDTNGCQRVVTLNVTYKGGCTDEDAINYDPLATFDNGTCYYQELTTSVNILCEEDNTGTVCVTAEGGTPPYTVVGIPNGVIANTGDSLCVNLPNGTNVGFYVVDALGNVTAVQKGTIDCPFDCLLAEIKSNQIITCLTDNLGNNTGEVIVTINPTGNNGPFTVVGTINNGSIGPFANLGNGSWGLGQSVINGDTITGTITDINGCTFNFNFAVNCPIPNPGGTDISCASLAEINVGANLYTALVYQLPFPTRTLVNYAVGFQINNLGAFGLDYSNVALFEYKLENTSVGLLDHYPVGMSGSPCNPCLGNLTPLSIGTPVTYATTNDPSALVASHTVELNSACLPGAFKLVKANIKVRLTIVMEDKTCTLCFAGNIEHNQSCDSTTGTGSLTLLTSINCNTY